MLPPVCEYKYYSLVRRWLLGYVYKYHRPAQMLPPACGYKCFLLVRKSHREYGYKYCHQNRKLLHSTLQQMWKTMLLMQR